ncbi:MAG: SynChlorMet cassette protein ScmC, partial [Proteobacteria bacterium]|nr:SynChlorMet cassette protein ScmC [Pseudomonadota bacterium]
VIVTCGTSELKHVELPVEKISEGNSCQTLTAAGWVTGAIRNSTYLMNPETLDIIYDLGVKKDRLSEFTAMWDLLKIMYLQVQKNGGIPFHAALIENSGKGIVLCARGDTGKSTCCKRIPLPWRPLCDDETLVVRVGPQQYAAHPFPTWSEYLLGNNAATWNVKQSVPLVAIAFLDQSSEDKLIPLKQAQAAVFINVFVSLFNFEIMAQLDREDKRVLRTQIFDNISNLARSVPSYILKVSLTGRFWEELEKIEGMI